MSETDLTRRDFLQRSMLLGAAIGASSLLSSCGGDGEAEPAGEGDEMAALDCTDVSALEEAEVTTREGLQYVDKSEIPDQMCSNCQHFTAPETEGTCGTCALVAGPINPDGYCLSWVAKA